MIELYPNHIRKLLQAAEPITYLSGQSFNSTSDVASLPMTLYGGATPNQLGFHDFPAMQMDSGALRLDGSGNPYALDGSEDFTIVAFLKFADAATPDSQFILDTHNATPNSGGYSLEWNAATTRFNFNYGTSTMEWIMIDPTPIEDGGVIFITWDASENLAEMYWAGDSATPGVFNQAQLTIDEAATPTIDPFVNNPVSGEVQSYTTPVTSPANLMVGDLMIYMTMDQQSQVDEDDEVPGWNLLEWIPDSAGVSMSMHWKRATAEDMGQSYDYTFYDKGGHALVVFRNAKIGNSATKYQANHRYIIVPELTVQDNTYVICGLHYEGVTVDAPSPWTDVGYSFECQAVHQYIATGGTYWGVEDTNWDNTDSGAEQANIIAEIQYEYNWFGYELEIGGQSAKVDDGYNSINGWVNDLAILPKKLSIEEMEAIEQAVYTSGVVL